MGSCFSWLVDAKVDKFSCNTGCKQMYVEFSIWDCLRIVYDVWSRSGSAFCMFVLGFKYFAGSCVALLVGAKVDQLSC